MTTGPDRATELAVWLFEREAVAKQARAAGESPVPRDQRVDLNPRDDVRAAVDMGTATVERLRRHLARWLGDEGIHALLLRALGRARATHPLLDHVYVGQDLRFGASWSTAARSPISVSQDLMPAADAAIVHDAFVAAVTQVIALLSRLVGEDTAARLVEDIWPATRTASGSEAAFDEQPVDSRKRPNNRARGGASTDQGEGAEE